MSQKPYLHIVSSLIAFAIVAGLSFSQANAAVVTLGELNTNPFLTGADYSGWTINSPWRANGGNDNLVFDVNNTNATGFPTASTLGKSLTSEANVLALDGYNPSTTRLTALQFNDIFLNTFGSASDGSYKFFLEFDLNTTSGNFRAKSQELLNPWTISGAQSLSMTWDTDPFASGGVALNSISSTEYKLVMFVETPTTDAGTTFLTVDNLSAMYTVTSIPEPSSLMMVAIGFVPYVVRRRRNTRGGIFK